MILFFVDGVCFLVLISGTSTLLVTLFSSVLLSVISINTSQHNTSVSPGLFFTLTLSHSRRKSSQHREKTSDLVFLLYLQSTGLYPHRHILGIASFDRWLDRKRTFTVILPIGILCSLWNTTNVVKHQREIRRPALSPEQFNFVTHQCK